jgi:NitT/TauT family transport system substrate-binding protein
MPADLSRRALLKAAGLVLAGSGAATAQTGRTPVRIGFVPVIGAASLYVMAGAGWAREAGLDIATTKFDSGPAGIQALASGTLDAMFIGVAPIAVARAKGVPVKVVAAAGLGGSGFAVSGALAAEFERAGGDAARAFAAFRTAQGRPARIGALPPGGVPTVALHHWLRRIARVDPADIQIAAMGIEAVQQAMLAGAVDGGTLLEPQLSIVLARNPALRVVGYARDFMPNSPGVVMAVTEAFAAAHPDAVRQLIRLEMRATDLIRSRPDEAAPHVQAALSGGLVETAIFAKALTSPAVAYLVDPREIVAATEQMLAFQVELGDFPVAPPVAGLFDSRFYEEAAAGPR